MHSRLVYAIVLAPLLVFIATGVLGIDFGYHWDEQFQFNLVQQTLKSWLLIPGWYQYPSVSYGLTLSGLLPHLLIAARVAGSDWHLVMEHLQLVAATPAYHLQVRVIFLLVSSLTIVWVFLQPLAAGRRWLEGLAAACLLGFSWEAAYHARWIAPDAVLMQFGALVVLLCTLILRQPERRFWMVAAAAAAGLGTGTKYPGGLLLVPVLIATCQSHCAKRDLKRTAWIFLQVLLVFTAAYLVSTPGTLLDPIRFSKDILYEMGHYQTGKFDQSVAPGAAHLGLILTYLARVIFSPYQAIALFLFILILAGIYALIRQRQPDTAVVLVFPALYLAYFCMQSVMAARNLLVTFPFLAVLAARGIFFVYERLPQRIMRQAWAGLLAVLLLINAAWLFSAAGTIRFRSPQRFLDEFRIYAAQHPGTSYSVSPKIWQGLQTLPTPPPANVVPLDKSETDRVVFYTTEGMQRPGDWPANQPGLAEQTFGSQEVNLDYYPLWAGDDHILVMSYQKARQLGFSIVK